MVTKFVAEVLSRCLNLTGWFAKKDGHPLFSMINVLIVQFSSKWPGLSSCTENAV